MAIRWMGGDCSLYFSYSYSFVCRHGPAFTALKDPGPFATSLPVFLSPWCPVRMSYITVRIHRENHIHFPADVKEVKNAKLRAQRIEFVNFSAQAPHMNHNLCIYILSFPDRQRDRSRALLVPSPGSYIPVQHANGK